MLNRKSLLFLLSFSIITAIAIGSILVLSGDSESENTDSATANSIVQQSSNSNQANDIDLFWDDNGREVTLNDAPQSIGEDQQGGQNGIIVSGGEDPSDSTVAIPNAPPPLAFPTTTAQSSIPNPLSTQPASSALSATPVPTFVAEQPEIEETESEFVAEINPFVDTSTDNLSTFSMDVDTGSYTIARNYLTNYGGFPPPASIRPEEFVNYFDAHYDGPEDDDPFAIHVDAAPSPFADEDTYLMRVGIQGRYIAPEDREPALLVFVIDVSGSMDQPNRLPLAKNALGILVNELREDDRVGIVVYSENSRVILDPTPASEKEAILDAIASLHPEASTNLNAGLELGYRMAEAYQSEDDGITRIILLSDGVANVGLTDPQAILNNAREKASEGITLNTIGFGLGEYNDELMEHLADNGDGSYFYIDNIRQARRIFVHQLTGTLQVIAFDARIQVDFNTDTVAEYRLIGYENRAIADADFRNDAEVDAAEIGAGHSVTGLYEIRLHPNAADGDIATVYVRYQDADTLEFEEVNQDFSTEGLFSDFSDMPATFRLHAVVAEFGEMLRGTKPDGDYVTLLEVASPLVDALSNDPDVDELVGLIRLAGQYIDVGR